MIGWKWRLAGFLLFGSTQLFAAPRAWSIDSSYKFPVDRFSNSEIVAKGLVEAVRCLHRGTIVTFSASEWYKGRNSETFEFIVANDCRGHGDGPITSISFPLQMVVLPGDEMVVFLTHSQVVTDTRPNLEPIKYGLGLIKRIDGRGASCGIERNGPLASFNATGESPYYYSTDDRYAASKGGRKSDGGLFGEAAVDPLAECLSWPTILEEVRAAVLLPRLDPLEQRPPVSFDEEEGEGEPLPKELEEFMSWPD
jgi:hypothetical protein